MPLLSRTAEFVILTTVFDLTATTAPASVISSYKNAPSPVCTLCRGFLTRPGFPSAKPRATFSVWN